MADSVPADKALPSSCSAMTKLEAKRDDPEKDEEVALRAKLWSEVLNCNQTQTTVSSGPVRLASHVSHLPFYDANETMSNGM